MIRIYHATALAVVAMLIAGILPTTPRVAIAVNAIALPAVTDADDRWGFNAIPTDPSSQRLAVDAGARWTRAEFRWDTVEDTRGHESWGDYDRLVEAMGRANISIEGILIGVPEWAKDPGARSMPMGLSLPYDNSQNLWARYVKSVATRYKGKVKYWEVWNEPDDPDVFWSGTTADYYQMLKVTYQAIKSVDPTAKVLMAGLAYFTNQYFLDDLLHLMAADPTAKANNDYFDILAWHVYSGPGGVLDRVADSQRLLSSTVGTRPIWINETNVPPWDESSMNDYKRYDLAANTAEQASYIIQTFAYAVAAGVDKVFVYRLRDEPIDSQAWGLVRDDGTLRPAYVGFQVATRYLSHTTSARRARQGSVEQVIARRPGERISVVWNRSGGAMTAKIGALATSATVIDATGATRQIAPVVGQYQIDLGPATAKAYADSTDFMIGGPPLFIREAINSDLQMIRETSPLIGFAGAWAPDSPAASAATARRTSSAGASASVKFDGTSVTWLTSKGPDRGIARVEVDGSVLGDIDLYSSTEVKEVPLTFGDFDDGTHRLTITATGRRVGSSMGAAIDVGGFQGATFQAAQATPGPGIAPPAPPTAPQVGARPQSAAYTAAGAPSPRLSLPVVTRVHDGWSSQIAITNTGDDSAEGRVRFLDPTGNEVATSAFTLGTVASTTLDPRQIAGLPDGFLGSADVVSSQPVSASVTQTRDGVDGLAYAPVSDATERAYVPLLFKGYSGWNSTMYVQNQGDAPATATISYYQSNVTSPPLVQAVIVPARSSVELSQAANPSLPSQFVGSATVVGPAGSQVSAVVNLSHLSGSTSSYESQSAGGSQLNAPLLYKDSNGWNTGIQVQNVGAVPAEVTVAYTASAGAAQWREQTTIPANGSVTFYQPSNTQLPTGFVGSAVVTSTNGQPLVGLVNGVQPTRSVATAYTTVATGSSMVWAPSLTRNADGWSTSVQVENVGSDPTSVTLLLQDASGVLLGSFTEPAVPAGGSHLFSLPALAGVPDGWRGSGTVVSPTGAPLAVIVSETRY